MAVSRAKPGMLGTGEFWHLVFISYFFLVVGFVVLELWFRLKLTHIYNLRAAKLRFLVLRACLESGLRPELDGKRLQFSAESRTYRYAGPAFGDTVWLSMKAAPDWAYGQLSWSRWDHPARAAVEEALGRVVAHHAPRESHVGTAFLAASTCVLVFSSGLSVLTSLGRLRLW
jgi:hypothetical protein